MTVSIYRILWGRPTDSVDPSTWPVVPSLAPVEGLPVRAAVFLLHRRIRQKPSLGVPGTDWVVDAAAARSLGSLRRIQLGFGVDADHAALRKRVPVTKVSVGPSVPGSASEHPARALARAFMPTHPDGLSLVLDVLTFLVLARGDESALDGLAYDAFSGPPARFKRWMAEFLDVGPGFHDALNDALQLVNKPPDPEFTKDLRQRLLDATRRSAVVARWSRLMDDQVVERRVPTKGTGELRTELNVRMAQVASVPQFAKIPSFGFATASGDQAAVLKIVTESVDGIPDGTDLVVFPEVTIPYECVPQLRILAEHSNVAILAGLTWRPVQFAKDATGATVVTDRWFVNEAVLIVPAVQGDTEWGSWVFRIRKPRPNLDELALAHVMSLKHDNWRILPGVSWYRFKHAAWGPFGVAICSDALDAGALQKLAGRVLHLFICCFNRDIELFEALTRVRAYELYANVVAVNHGSLGGSFAWSPRHTWGKEIAHLRGPALRIVADVKLPVAALDASQQEGQDVHVAAAMAKTWGVGVPSSSEFKAPPPHWRRS